MITPTSSKVAAIGACGLHQPVAPRAEGVARGLDQLLVGNRVLERVGARGLGKIDVEHEIEHKGLSDLGLMRHHAVISVEHEPIDEDDAAHRARLIAAATASA